MRYRLLLFLIVIGLVVVTGYFAISALVNEQSHVVGESMEEQERQTTRPTETTDLQSTTDTLQSGSNEKAQESGQEFPGQVAKRRRKEPIPSEQLIASEDIPLDHRNKLTEEELEELKISNFHAFLRYQAKEQGVEREPSEAEREKILKEEVLPQLLERLEARSGDPQQP